MVQHWLWVHAGLSGPNSVWYLFWSGIAANWTRSGVIITAVALYGHNHHYRTRGERHARRAQREAMIRDTRNGPKRSRRMGSTRDMRGIRDVSDTTL